MVNLLQIFKNFTTRNLIETKTKLDFYHVLIIFKARHSREADPGQCPGQLHGPAPHGGAPGQEAGPDHFQLPSGEGRRAASTAADLRGSEDR